MAETAALDARLEVLAELVQAHQGEALISSEIENGELTLFAEPARIVELCKFLRDAPGCQFTTLIDICGVDWPAREKRFDVVYHLPLHAAEPALAGQSDAARG